MVEAQGPNSSPNAGAKPNVMVMGTLGTGKSTLLNRMSGQEEDLFVARLQTEGCTQEPKIAEAEGFKLIDTPGLNDPNMTTNEWQTTYNKWLKAQGPVRIDLAVLVFKQNVRPSVQDANSLAVLKQAIESCNPGNVVIVFTFCDEINPKKRGGTIDLDYLHKWYNETLIKSKSATNIEGLPFPEIPKERIFMFKGEDKDANNPETTTQEINQFILNNIPDEANATKKFNYAKYLISMKCSNNSDMVAAGDAEI